MIEVNKYTASCYSIFTNVVHNAAKVRPEFCGARD